MNDQRTRLRLDPERGMSRYSKELYDAWLAGFDAGWDERGDGNYPVKGILRALYWAWRRERKVAR